MRFRTVHPDDRADDNRDDGAGARHGHDDAAAGVLDHDHNPYAVADSVSPSAFRNLRRPGA
jgi:hypothetical protein